MTSTSGAGRAAPVRGPLRWLRGAVVGGTATLLASTGHAWGGGSAPTPVQLAGLAVPAVLVAVALSGHRWRLPSLLGVLAWLQVVVHVALSGGADLVVTGHTSMSHGSVSLGPVSPEMPGMHAMGPAMLLGHALAVVLTGLLLRRGEDWCWALVELLSRPVGALRLLLLPVPATGHDVPVAWRTPAPHAVLRGCSLTRRGPPVALAA